ncbi:MAG: hypothetical protein AB7V55_05895, partial [Oscillospiraceae bacterium]
WVFSLFYKRLLTLLASQKLKSDYRLGELGARGSLSALLRKEGRKFLGTPVLTLNGGFGVLLAVVGGIAALFFKETIAGFLAEAMNMGVGELLTTYLTPGLLAAAAFLCSMTYISCVSISLEGKTLWILKEAPLGTGRIFAAKAGFNLLLSGTGLVVCVLLLWPAFSLPVLDVVCMLVLGLLFTTLCSTLGLFVNLLLPRMDAENDTMVVKNSASVIVTMLVEFVLLALFVVLFILVRGLGFGVYTLISGAILLALNAGVLLLLNTTGRKLFAQL